MCIFNRLDTEKNSEQLSSQKVERYLRYFFTRIHQALSELLRRGYVYTDFKPDNVLIDFDANKPYLIDLESVVLQSAKYCCIRTPLFWPPMFYKNSGSFIKTPHVNDVFDSGTHMIEF